MLTVDKDHKIPIIALEGMPRCGKSSTIKYLKRIKKTSVFLPELYFTEEQLLGLKDKKGTIDESKWFIEQEIRRKNEIVTDNCLSVIVDRMYLSTLAYCFARSKLNKNPEEFRELIKYYDLKKHLFLEYDHIIIFNNDVETTISRRKDKLSADKQYWIDRKFMKYYQYFYLNMSKKIEKGKITVLNTRNLKLKEIYKQVKKIIDTYSELT
ncbi:MAG: AAA family ATPase [Candidatus Shapirobacteria bacterium]